MSIDFEIPAEAKAIREKVRKWVHDECIPAEKELDTKPLAEVLGPLRKRWKYLKLPRTATADST